MTDTPTARERIENLWDRAFLVAPYLDSFAAEVTAAAYRAAADIAHAEGNRLYDDSGQRHAQGAWAVRDALRARANEMEQQ